jgi:pimeloyl-ACP methyl ester carboxylesterase
MNKSSVSLKNDTQDETTFEAPWLSLDTTGLNTKPEQLHFSAANGFPVASYQSFLELLTPQFNVTAMDSRGAWPVRQVPSKGFSCHSFADDLINGISTTHQQPVIGMGHSHGGQLTVIAALKRPELFSKLVIIEPASLPNPFIDMFYRQLPKWVLFKLFPFMRGSEMRRKIWPSREAFIQKYRDHETFTRFTEDALADYAQHGLFEREDKQFELVFDPLWESYIFRKVEFLWKFLRQTTHPTLIIRAEHSNIYSSEQFKHYNKNLPNNIHSIEMPNSHHLLPQEVPERLVAEIDDWLQSN